MAEKIFDIIIFGASGYTGKYVIRNAIDLLDDYKWAIAGRNLKKLRECLKEAEIFCNKSLNIPIIIADISNYESLKEMTKQAKVIVNCCGPYRFYGEPVVKACIETCTSHVDVSGEPQYMETMQLKYHEAACEKGIYIVSACGFDSIPADLGTVYLQRNFKGTVNSIKIYTKTRFLNDFDKFGAVVNYTTYESAVYGLSRANELREVRKQLFAIKLPKLEPLLKEKSGVHRSKDLDNKWCLSIPSADHSVVMRSQRYFYENNKQRPIQLRTFTTYESFLNILKTVVAGVILREMTKYKCGRDLLLTYPEVFSFGFTSRKGPSEEQNANTVFEMIFIGEGWDEKFDDPIRKIDIPLDKKMMCKVTCINPLYGVASKSVLLSAITILNDRENMPAKGGVYSPGCAFKNTFLIKRLQDCGVTFEIMNVKEIKAKL